MAHASHTPRIRSDELDQPKRISQVNYKPERNLASAVLSRAIVDLYSKSLVEDHVRRSAKLWIEAPLDSAEPFSFAWIADALDICPFALQKLIQDIARDSERLEKCLFLMR